MTRLTAVALALLLFGACAADEDVVPAESTTTTADVAELLPQASTTTPTTTAGVSYANCDEVKAAGAAPLERGEPGYRAGLDRDNDGVACDK